MPPTPPLEKVFRMPGKITYGSSQVPLSPAVRAGDFVYISGQVPTDASGSIVNGPVDVQTKQVMENVKAALALAGCTLDQVVKTTVILADARDFGAFNRVYATYFAKEPPARTTIEARLMVDIRIEIEAVTLDDFWRQQNLVDRRPAFLKMDVEGYELFVLRGAHSVLQRCASLLVEYSPAYMRKAGVEPAALYDLLAGTGLHVHEIDGAGDLKPVERASVLAMERQRNLFWRREQ